jgi:hypothetical protein
MIKMTSNEVACPSATCKEGANLLGIIQPDGRVSFLNQKLNINEEFVQIAHRGRSPEKRFRFSNNCIKSSCKQWTGDRCGVIDRILDEVGIIEEPPELPECSIRSECRWYNQCGGKACAICPEVITNSLEE